MKKINFFLVAIIAALTISCNSEPSLSKREALNFILQETGEDVQNHTYIPNKIKTVAELAPELDRLKIYQSSGLLSLKDTVVSVRDWNSWRKVYIKKAALDISITSQVAASIVDRQSEKDNVKTYAFTFDKIVDLRLLGREKLDNIDGELCVYAVYYKGSITQASPFATALGINVEGRYPFDTEGEECVMAAKFKAIYHKGKLVEIYASGSDVIKESEIDVDFDERWLEMVNTNI